MSIKLYLKNGSPVLVSPKGGKSIGPIATEFDSVGRVTIISLRESEPIVGPIPYNQIFKEDGVTPIATTLSELENYLSVFNTASGGSEATQLILQDYVSMAAYNGCIIENVTLFSENLKKLTDAGICNSASLIYTPYMGGIGKLLPIKPLNRLADFTWVISTIKTRVDRTNNLQTLAVNAVSINWYNGKPYVTVGPAVTNLYLNTTSLATQNVVTTAQTYTVSFYGTGTLTFSGSYTGSLVGTGANNRVSLSFTATAGTLTTTVTGSVTSAMLNTGLFLSSYFPSAGTPGSRNGDSVQRNGLINYLGQSSGGTAIVDILISRQSAVIRSFFQLSNSVGGNVFAITSNAAGAIVVSTYVNGGYVEDVVSATGILSNVGNYQLAFTYKQSEYKVYLNGVLVASSTNAASFTSNVDRIILLSGADGFGNQIFYQSVKTPAEIASIYANTL